MTYVVDSDWVITRLLVSAAVSLHATAHRSLCLGPPTNAEIAQGLGPHARTR